MAGRVDANNENFHGKCGILTRIWTANGELRQSLSTYVHFLICHFGLIITDPWLRDHWVWMWDGEQARNLKSSKHHTNTNMEQVWECLLKTKISTLGLCIPWFPYHSIYVASVFKAYMHTSHPVPSGSCVYPVKFLIPKIHWLPNKV